MNYLYSIRFVPPALLLILLFTPCAVCAWGTPQDKQDMEKLRARIESYVPDPKYQDDPYALETLKEAIEALSSGSGGIGACLVDERTGKVIERGRNRQYTPYFRSDMHAEMDLLDRWEDRLRKEPLKNGGDPRRCEGIVLYSSYEPCPMCLVRIINSGIKKLYYVAPDPSGGMVTRMDDLPPFWRTFAQDREYTQARCSPVLSDLADELFHFAHRDFAKRAR